MLQAFWDEVGGGAGWGEVIGERIIVTELYKRTSVHPSIHPSDLYSGITLRSIVVFVGVFQVKRRMKMWWVVGGEGREKHVRYNSGHLLVMSCQGISSTLCRWSARRLSRIALIVEVIARVSCREPERIISVMVRYSPPKSQKEKTRGSKKRIRTMAVVKKV